MDSAKTPTASHRDAVAPFKATTQTESIPGTNKDQPGIKTDTDSTPPTVEAQATTSICASGASPSLPVPASTATPGNDIDNNAGTSKKSSTLVKDRTPDGGSQADTNHGNPNGSQSSQSECKARNGTVLARSNHGLGGSNCAECGAFAATRENDTTAYRNRAFETDLKFIGAWND
ncbi:hypothetical protein BJ508DRAFT_307494 [Ascobolus immersus RN42]|uniref:Uncharacterized protein n=1 Tax=Ascobolus immersus RN42 TaxID=1160509 RepID=A0A3N4I2H3_ASCIM|nr:hypothetical protein BJ508DRAFT_307494 [Ascobolus immersus RN42]